MNGGVGGFADAAVRGKSSVCFYGRGKHMRNHPKVMSAVLTFLCALLTASAAFAATPSVMDRAHLLSKTERRVLSAKIAAIEEKYDVRIVVGTQKSIHGQAPKAYVDKVMKRYYTGRSGGTILLLVTGDAHMPTIGADSAMRERISCGYGRQYAEDAMRADLMAGHYATAFTQYVDAVEEMLAFHRDNGRAMTAVDESIGIVPVLSALGAGIAGFFMNRVRVLHASGDRTDSAAP